VSAAREERPPEHADFAATRVGGSRRRPPIVALGFLVVLAAVVALGLSGRSPGTGAAATAAPSAPGGVAATTLGGTPARSVAPSPDAGAFAVPPAVSTFGSKLLLQVRRGSVTVYLHGDVWARGVSWVYVSVLDGEGRVAGWASVSVPGGAAAGTSDVPSLRFDTEVAIPAWAADEVLWVQATGYDTTAKIVASAQLGVERDGGPAESPAASPVATSLPPLD
jgi:hypothetical protein